MEPVLWLKEVTALLQGAALRFAHCLLPPITLVGRKTMFPRTNNRISGMEKREADVRSAIVENNRK
jgi:uncharacterized membrane protein